MLSFDCLKNLDTHITFLQKRIKDPHTIFLVGGCVRDLLLSIEKNPTDIDFTMAGDPSSLYQRIDTKGLSHFITEKFGTITIFQKNLRKYKKIGRNSDISDTGDKVRLPNILAHLSDSSVIKHELTPLRTEGEYEDFRHPGEIKWSNDILLDSQRRDFTINGIYYTNVPYKSEYAKLIASKNIHKYSDDETFLKRLDDHGYLYIKNLGLLIIQNHKHISKLFADGIFNTEYLKIMLKSATLFSLGKHLKTGRLTPKSISIVVDPHKGIHDSINKRLRAIGDPDKRFNEDALRIIRAIRFVNVLNNKLKEGRKGIKGGKKTSFQSSIPLNSLRLFDFIKETRGSVKKNHALVKNVAKERIKEEIMKAFTVGDPFGFIALLDEAGLLKHLFPALRSTKHIEQPVRYHPFDVYTHTLLTLLELQKINKDPLVRLAMLYHDVGKVEQFGSYADNLSKEEIREILAGPLNHRRSSPEYAKRDFKSIGLSSKEIMEIVRYITNHHKPEEILTSKEENTEKKVRALLSDAGYERAMNLMDIIMADRLGQYNPLQNSSDIFDVNKLKVILKKLHKSEGQFLMKHLAINGSDIIKHFKLKPSPTIGVLLKKAMERVMSDIKARNTEKEIFDFLKIQLKHLKN